MSAAPASARLYCYGGVKAARGWNRNNLKVLVAIGDFLLRSRVQLRFWKQYLLCRVPYIANDPDGHWWREFMYTQLNKICTSDQFVLVVTDYGGGFLPNTEYMVQGEWNRCYLLGSAVPVTKGVARWQVYHQYIRSHVATFTCFVDNKVRCWQCCLHRYCARKQRFDDYLNDFYWENPNADSVCWKGLSFNDKIAAQAVVDSFFNYLGGYSEIVAEVAVADAENVPPCTGRRRRCPKTDDPSLVILKQLLLKRFAREMDPQPWLIYSEEARQCAICFQNVTNKKLYWLGWEQNWQCGGDSDAGGSPNVFKTGWAECDDAAQIMAAETVVTLRAHPDSSYIPCEKVYSQWRHSSGAFNKTIGDAITNWRAQTQAYPREPLLVLSWAFTMNPDAKKMEIVPIIGDARVHQNCLWRLAAHENYDHSVTADRSKLFWRFRPAIAAAIAAREEEEEGVEKVEKEGETLLTGLLGSNR